MSRKQLRGNSPNFQTSCPFFTLAFTKLLYDLMPPLFDKERVTFDLLVELPVIDFDNIHLHDVIYFSIDNYNPTCCIDHFDTCFLEFQNNFEYVGLGTYLCHFRNMTDDARVCIQPVLEK